MGTTRCSGRPWGWPGGGSAQEGVCMCLPRMGVCLPGGVHLPPVNRITDRSKNITFPQLRLRTVKTGPNTYRCRRVWRWCGGQGGCCRGTSPRRSDTRSYRARPGSRSSGGSSCAPSGCSCERTASRKPSMRTAGYLVEKRCIVFNGLFRQRLNVNGTGTNKMPKYGHRYRYTSSCSVKTSM